MITINPFLFLFLFPIFILPPITSTAHHSATNCDKSCGPGHLIHDFPYPIGFSSGCQIRLNCSQNGTAFIGQFPVQSVSSDNIKVSMEAKCNRPLHTIRQLFSHKYAPTSRNAILLQNCTTTVSSCNLPETMVKTRFETPNCTVSDGNISCYAPSTANGMNGFIDLKNLTNSQCGFLLSSISAEILAKSTASVSLEVQTVELGWWLEGKCQCAGDANCTEFVSPTHGGPVYRCQCREGFVGDGYLAGTGCRKASSHCYPMTYIYNECGGTTRIIALIAGVAGGALLMVCLGLICCFIRRRSKQKARHITKRRLNEATGNCTIPIYPYKEIEKATNFFSDKHRLGNGAYGTVYAGKLRSDEWVAIKRIKNRDTEESIEQVMNEIKLLSSVSHPNLVRLLGCSIENNEQILVYEFMPNGTLCQHLQRERGDGLAWPIRLKIATETAQAIAHLHSAIKPPIFHRDIKSSNILLDYNFKSKVADFGLSRLGLTEISHISTAPQGTPGYLDPQYHQDFHLSDKSDVYSFGVVLVEIITGLKVVDFSRPTNEVNLAALAIDRIGSGRLDEIIDSFIEPYKDSLTLLSVQKMAELAFRCLAFHRDMRPSMMEVAAELEQIGERNWISVGEKSFNGVSEASSCISYNSIEILLSDQVEKDEFEYKALALVQTEAESSNNSMERAKDNSPISVQDPWLSEQSSPSSSSLLSNVVQ